jgi:hypothetical protein
MDLPIAPEKTARLANRISPVVCQECVAGTSDHDANAASPCEYCPSGQFTSVNAATECNHCQVGEYAAENSTACIRFAIEPGHHDKRDPTTCNMTQPLSCSPLPQACLFHSRGSCNLIEADDTKPLTSLLHHRCSPGRADADKIAATPCTPCPAGKWSHKIAATTCAGECVAGTDTAVGGKMGITTTETKLGCNWDFGDGIGGYEVSVGDTDTADECASLVQAIAPDANGATWYAPAGTACWAEYGMTQSNGATNYVSCEFRFVTIDTVAEDEKNCQCTADACVQCHVGSFDHDRDSRTPCLPCAAGRVSSTSGAFECEECSRGSFSASSSNVCEQCPAGTYGTAAGAGTMDSL